MTQQCQHSACTCQDDESRMIQRNGAYYCSEKCAATASASGPCTCGHPDCQGTKAK